MNPIEMVEKLRSAYVNYLQSTIPVADAAPAIGQMLASNLQREGELFKGPYVEMALPNVSGSSITQLMAEGVAHQNFSQLNQVELPLDRPLYAHQELAFRHLAENNRNIIGLIVIHCAIITNAYGRDYDICNYVTDDQN